MIGISFQCSGSATRFEGQVIDDGSGAPSAARVAVTDSAGREVEIEGDHPHVQYLGKRWAYVSGQFAFTIPQNGASIEVRRGLETLPESVSIAGGAGGRVIQKTFRLRRWVDMRGRGYLSGDMHAHLPVPEEALPQMQAEDLQALNLLYLPDPQNPIAVNERFTGRLDRNSIPGCEIFVGQEIQDWQMGHLTLLGLSRLVPGYPDFGGAMEYWKSNPHWDLIRAMRAVREQQGTVVWSHFSSLPGAQLPIAAALGLVDAIELLTWNDPVQLPNHWDPWENSGMTLSEFPVMRPVDLYYQFLNAGFRLPVAAGTDKFIEDIPLGSNRTYVRAGGARSNYAAWLAGARAGKSFISNGPILEFEADGREAGDVVQFSGKRRIGARVRARSLLPFTTLEIVLNGITVSHKTVAIFNNPPVDGLYSMEIEATVELDRSGWLAARVVDHPDLHNRILPRDVSVFAHTSPVYFLKNGKKVREMPSIKYLRKWVKGAQHWLATRPSFVNEEDRMNAVRDADEALRFYERL